MKKQRNTNSKYDWLYSVSLIVAILLGWQLVSAIGLVPSFMLPSLLRVVRAFIRDFPLLMENLGITLWEAALGLGSGVAVGFLFALIMDRWAGLRKALYPLLVFSQTVPTVAVAPLLVLWMGYGILPKVVIVFLVTFFPITVTLLESFRATDPDQLRLLQAMGASESQLFYYVKWPQAMESFFAALKVSASYSVVGAVIAEWLGGTKGLGVYMTQVRKSFSYDKMFAVIFLISALSLVLLFGLDIVRKRVMPWKRVRNRKENNEKTT